MTSILDTNELVNFLNKNPDIGMNQLLFCLLHHHDEQYMKKNGMTRIKRPLSVLYAYIDSHSIVNEKGKKVPPFKRSEIEALIEKGYIAKLGSKISMDMIQVTKKFKQDFFGNYEFEEFFEEYPTFVPNWNHPSHPDIKLKGSDKELIEKLYKKKIKTEASHNRVVEIVKWAKENNQINMNIENFIRSEMWDQLEQIKHKSTRSRVDL